MPHNRIEQVTSLFNFATMALTLRILIIKTGAAGDVVRTTTLLNAFWNQETIWLTNKMYLSLIDQKNIPGLKAYDIEDIPSTVFSNKFNLIVSLEESEFCARLVSRFQSETISGIYWDGGIRYTPDTSAWFDMSLVSVYGKFQANVLKRQNLKSYQEIVYPLTGHSFKGEGYLLAKPQIVRNENLIGIEKHSGLRWPGKQWVGYDELGRQLEKKGYSVRFFTKRPSIKEYLDDIAGCGLIISGDTLAMHLAIAFNIPSVALFNCTSPTEIYDYGRLEKIISPRLFEYYYSNSNDPAIQSAITVSTVRETVLRIWAKNYQ